MEETVPPGAAQADPLAVWRNLLNGTISVLGILYLLEIWYVLGIDFVPWQEQYTAILLGAALASVLASPWRGGAAAGSWPVRLGLSLLGLAAGLYIAVHWTDFAAGVFRSYDVWIAWATVALILEATRRSVGPALFILGILTVAFGATAGYLPPPLHGRTVELQALVMYLYSDTSGIMGLPLTVSATVVLPFVLFGVVVFFAGGGQVFIDLSLASLGRTRGGPAKAAIMASSLFGSISGSAVANVVATGSLTIPLMKRTGYRPELAGGVEAVASTGGQLMPPVMGATAFLMADFLGRPYAEVALAALMPALLFYLCLFVQVHLEAAKTGLRAMDPADLPPLRPVLARSWLLLAPLAVLIVLLFFMNWEASRAAFAGSAVALLAGLIDKRGRIWPRDIWNCLSSTGRGMLDLLVVTAMAGLVVGALGITGVGFSFALQIVDLAGGNVLMLLVLTALTGLILGMGMPTTGVYILLAVLAAPALVQLGIPPMAAHMFVLYYGMLSMITPPVCLASFAAASIAGADNMRTGFTSMRLGGASYIVPFVFALSPVLLLEQGFTWEFFAAALAATIGVIGLGAALVGYLLRPLGWGGRAVCLVAALLLIWPIEYGAGAIVGMAGNLVGLTLLAALAAWHYRGRPRSALATSRGNGR